MGNNIEDWLIPGLGTANEWAHTAASMLYNSAESQKNRDWQEMMSNTAHTREVADLRRAGLNPILTATGGSGASSPVGGSASIGIGSSDSASLIQARTQKRLARKQEDNTEADTNYKKILWSKTHEEDNNAFLQGLNLFKEGKQIEANTAKTLADIENSKALTKAQIFNLIEGGNFNKRRSGGYSESHSSDNFKGVRAGKFGEFGWGTGSSSHSRSW